MATFYNIRSIKARTHEQAIKKIEDEKFNEKDVFNDSILSPQQFKDAPFPNGFDFWMETHHEIVSAIARNPEDAHNKINDIEATQGTGGLYEFGKELTDKFEELHRDTNWGEEEKMYLETLEEFLEQELKND